MRSPILSKLFSLSELWQKPVFIIAEVAQSHDGSLGQAHAFIDAVASTKAHAIKFQTHIAGAESSPNEPFRVQFSYQDSNRYDYWLRTAFTPDQWAGLAQHAKDKGLIFLSSAFSLEAVELLEKLGMCAWKVGSGEASNRPLLEAMARTGKPILLSSGLSTWAELDEQVSWLQGYQVPLALLQATSLYPTPPEKVGLNIISELSRRYPSHLIGLSDHSATIYPSLAAFSLGARIFEVHVTLSPYMFGPDVKASLTIEALQQLVEGLQFLERTAASPVDKDTLAEELDELRRIFQKSIVASSELAAGTCLEEKHIAFKKPGTGISAKNFREVLGKTLTHTIAADAQLQWDDFS